MLTSPVRFAPCHVVRSRARRFSQTHHHASRQSPQLVADFSSSATGATKTSAYEKLGLACRLPERTQEKEGKV